MRHMVEALENKEKSFSNMFSKLARGVNKAKSFVNMRHIVEAHRNKALGRPCSNYFYMYCIMVAYNEPVIHTFCLDGMII